MISRSYTDTNSRRRSGLIVIAYSIFGVLWILFSDTLVKALAPDVMSALRFQTYKGLLFILVTALLLYVMIRRTQTSLRLLQTSVDTASHWVFWARNDASICYVNDSMCRDLGYSREEFLAMSAMEIDATLSSERHAELWRQAKLRGSHSIEGRFKTKSGRIIPVEITGHYTRVWNGEFLFTFVRDITERKQSEDRLRQMEYVIESASGVIAIANLDMKMTYGNPAFLEMWGFDDSEEFLGKPCTEYWSFGDRYDEIMDSLKIRGRWAGELKALRNDGSSFDVQLAAATVRDNNGTPTGFTYSSVEITQYKQAVEALRQERDRAQKYLDVAGVMFVAIDVKGDVTLVNRRASEILGYTVDEIVGKNWFDTCLPAHVRDEVKTLFHELLVGETAEIEQHRNPVVTKSGEERIIAWHNTVLRDDEGNIVGTLSSGNDITDHKQAEDALRESRVLLNDVGRIAKIGGWKMDLITGKATWTRGTYDIVEIKYDDPIPGPDEHVDYYLPEHRPWVAEAMRALIEEDKPLDFEAQIRTAKGNIKWCRALGKAIRQEGKAVTVLGTIHDITERKEAEESLRRQSRFDALIARVLARFAQSDAAGVDDSIVTSLKEIGQFTGADSAFVLLMGPDRTTWSTTHSWVAPGFPDHSNKYQDVPAGEYPWGRKKMLEGEIVSIASVNDFPPEADIDRRAFERDGACSQLLVPLHGRDGQTAGCVGLRFYGQETRWIKEDLPRIEMVSEAIVNVLDRRLAEESLQQSESKYRNLFESAGDAILLMEPTGDGAIIVGCNRKAAEFWGGEIVGKSPVDFSPREQPDGQLSTERMMAIMSAAQAGQPQVFEWRHFQADGTPCDIEITVVRIPQPGNVQMLAIQRDITERKKTQVALEEALSEIRKLKERIEAENVYLREEIRVAHLHGEIVLRSDAMHAVLAHAKQVAETDSTVLLLGETGTGKELLARAIHNMSPRKRKPLVIVNCAALPGTLVESELFGREKGAYTGALTKQIGRFEAANGGSLFLDEIGELPAETQVKLLRVLQEGQFERLGSTDTVSVDVRVIAATNLDLDKAVREGSFREDLFFRLNVFPITIPPLRERVDDIEPMVWSFVSEFATRMGKRIETISQVDMEALRQYTWPGNVRELRNLVERAMILTRGSALRIRLAPKSEASQLPGNDASLDQVQRQHILTILDKTGWRIRGDKGAARILGMNPTTLESRMTKLNIKRPQS